VRIGELRSRVTLQRESRVADGGGGYANVWTDLGASPTVWARIEPLRGREVLQALKLQAPVSHLVTLRNRADVTAGMRLVAGGRAFNIRAAINLEERGRWLELLCEEGVAG